MDNKRSGLHILLLLASLLVVTAALTGCQPKKTAQKQNLTVNQEVDSAPEEEGAYYDTEILGVVKEVDSIQNSITIYDIEGNLDMVFSYSGGTDIRDAYDKMITADQLELGEIVKGYYYLSDRKLTKLSISEEAWTYNGVDIFSIDQSENIITLAKRKYQYGEGLMITDGTDLIEAIDLNTRDELTVKGIGKHVYSLRVTKGHGYIRLKNEEAFLGGTIEVGYGIIMPIEKDMLLVAREGSYKIVLENGELQAVKNIRLSRDEELTLDLSDYPVEKERVGYVMFSITPLGADLYINGILVNYADPIKLNYGEHIIRVTMTGYQDFIGILNIGESTSTVRISLAEESSEPSDSSGADSSVSSPGNEDEESDENSVDEKTDSNTTLEETDEDSTDKEEEVEIDENHIISIDGPKGAKVYLNGSLKGTAPLAFPKEIGTHTITLRKDGYKTKSYTVVVEDDGQDITLNFPDMVPSSK